MNNAVTPKNISRSCAGKSVKRSKAAGEDWAINTQRPHQRRSRDLSIKTNKFIRTHLI